MGYGYESQEGIVVKEVANLATIVMQTPADKAISHIMGPCTVGRLTALVTLAQTVTAAVVALDRRVLAGSDVGRVELARITIPVGLAAGKEVYKDFDAVDLDMGDQLVIELITASTAGAAVVSFNYIPRAETPANQGDAVLSA